LLYSVISAAWGTFIFIREGTAYNAIYDFIISLTLIIGLTLHRIYGLGERNIEWTKRLQASIAIILLLSLATNFPKRYFETKSTLRNILYEKSVVADDIDFLASIEGPAICEDLSLCYWADKGFNMDFSNTRQKIRSGIIDKKKLTNLIEQQYFSVIQIDKGRQLIGANAFTKDIDEKMFKYYKILRNSPYSGLFLDPKTP